ncbi:MAG: anthranilate phosphoribosyltransferase [Promethearchaeota archaeon]
MKNQPDEKLEGEKDAPTARPESEPIMKAAIRLVVGGEDLTFDQCESVMNEIMAGKATPAQIAAFLTALHVKGETAEEISACATVMRRYATRISPDVEGELLDTCGTGGDGLHTFNVSTVSALVAAAAGVPVAKHGNRAMSSSCGSADLFEALGVNLDAPPEVVKRCIETVGIGFLFAPKFHPAMRFASPVRREVGIPTVFNVLGPLTNPAGASTHLLGARNLELAKLMADVLHRLGMKRAFVAHGHGGIDEVSISGPTSLYEVTPAGVESFTVSPGDFGLPLAKLDEVVCRGKDLSVEAAVQVLENRASAAKRNLVLMNAGLAIAAGTGRTPEEGVELAKQVLEEGRAVETLKNFVVASGGTPRV